MADRVVTPSADWTTRHVPTWKSWLANLIGRPDVKGLEIGVCGGRSSDWFCRNVLTGAGARLDCVDHWKKYVHEESKFDQRTAGLPARKLRGSSASILPRLLLDGERYHLIYVDGCHHAEGVLFDLVLSWAMLLPGGVLIADDYGWTNRRCRVPVRVAVDAWLACVIDSLAGYEISRTNQLAAWKRG